MVLGVDLRQEGQQAGTGSLRVTGVPGAAEKAEGESGRSPGGGGELEARRTGQGRERPAVEVRSCGQRASPRS